MYYIHTDVCFLFDSFPFVLTSQRWRGKEGICSMQSAGRSGDEIEFGLQSLLTSQHSQSHCLGFAETHKTKVWRNIPGMFLFFIYFFWFELGPSIYLWKGEE